jgi:hypothetical protein
VISAMRAHIEEVDQRNDDSGDADDAQGQARDEAREHRDTGEQEPQQLGDPAHRREGRRGAADAVDEGPDLHHPEDDP